MMAGRMEGVHMLETQAERWERQGAALARLLVEVRADPLVRPPEARPEHFATAFSNGSATVFRARCRCGWMGPRYALPGPPPYAEHRKAEIKRKATRDAYAHNHGGNEAA